MNRLPARNPVAMHAQRGAGLIEVLVAVLVLSIGLLGIGMIQTRALANNSSAMGRSMSVIASYSIFDAMRADRVNAVGGSYNTTVIGNACSGSGSLAAVQLLAWCNELANTLGPVATTRGTIVCNAAGICTVTIQFDDSRIGAGGSSTQQVVTRAML